MRLPSIWQRMRQLADAVTPQAGELHAQGFADGARIVGRRDSLAKKADDPMLNRLVELFEIALRTRVNSTVQAKRLLQLGERLAPPRLGQPAARELDVFLVREILENGFEDERVLWAPMLARQLLDTAFDLGADVDRQSAHKSI